MGEAGATPKPRRRHLRISEGRVKLMKCLALVLWVTAASRAQTILNSTDNLQNAIDAAPSGATLLLNPGTYSLAGTLTVTKALTIRNNQPTRPTLQFPAGTSVAVRLSASSIAVEGVNIAGGMWGIYAGIDGGPSSNVVVRNVGIDTLTGAPGSAHGVYFKTVASAIVENVTVQDAQFNGILIDDNSPNATVTGCTVVTTLGPDAAIKISNSASAYVAGNTVQNTGSGAHGILLNASDNSLVTGNVIVHANANGILVDNNSSNATVINNTVQATDVQHGIAVKNSNNATVAGNTITGSGFHGILLIGAQHSRVARNNISGIKHDGITLAKEDATSRTSVGNYVGNNSIVSTARQSGITDGTGIWLNQESNGTLVYANSATGAPENGLAIFNSSNNHLFGNVIWNNAHGGIFVYGPTDQFPGPAPAYTVLQGNYAYDLPANAGVNLRQSSASTVFDNFVRSSPLAFMQQTTSGNRIFENTGANLQIGLYAHADTSASSYFLNRHLTAAPNYTFSPASIAIDGGPVLRGNYWAGHNSTAPYSNFIYNAGGATGVYRDNYPFADDTLGKKPYISVLYPSAGTYASAGSQKTIEWRSGGCAYVDIYYQSGATGLVSIASSYPDVGVYRWTVPTLPQGADYTVYIDCKNGANQSRGANGQSGAFTITKAGIELLTPQGNERMNAGAQIVVAWKRIPAVTGVDVLYRASTTDAFQLLLSNVTRDAVSIPAPAGSTSHGSFLVRASNDNGIADSTDGFVNVRSAATPTVTGPTGSLQIGTLHQVQWTSLPSSQYVDVQYLNTTTGAYVPLIQNLPDFGRFTFLVPEQTMTGSKIRVLMKSSPPTVVSTIDSSTTFDSSPTGDGGEPTPPPTPPPPTGVPELIGLAPLSGSATSGTFTGTYDHPNGAAGHYLGYMLFLPTPNVVNYVATGSCLVEYNRISNGMRLVNDAGTNWLGGIEGVPVGPGGTTLSNNVCTLDTRLSSAQINGTRMIVNARITFKAALTGVLGTFLQEADVNDNWTGMTQFGNWVAYAISSPKSGPYIASGSPQSGAGSSTAFSVTTGHTGGIGQLSMVHVMITPKIVGGNPCHIVFFPSDNSVALISSDGTALVPGFITPGTQTGSLTNGRCTVSGSGMQRTNAGNNVTIRLPISFTTETFGGTKNVYANTFDKSGFLTHWQQLGVWTVQ